MIPAHRLQQVLSTLPGEMPVALVRGKYVTGNQCMAYLEAKRGTRPTRDQVKAFMLGLEGAQLSADMEAFVGSV